MKLIAKSFFFVGLCTAQLGWGADPLDSWTTTNSPVLGGLAAVAFGNNLFVAVGGGTIASSSDAATWIQRNPWTNNIGLNGVAFGGGQFVAVGGHFAPPLVTAAVATSSDGIVWTQQNPGTTNVALYEVAYGNGQYVAVGNDRAYGVVISSSDGVNWVTRVSSATTPNDPPGFTSVAYGNGIFLVLGQGGSTPVATSADGINWTITPGGGIYSPSVQPALTFGNGLFVATSGGYTLSTNHSTEAIATIWSSPDGINWTARTNAIGAGGDFFSDVAYGGGQFIAVGPTISGVNATFAEPRAYYSSGDGTNWVEHDVAFGLSSVTFGSGRFVGLAGTNALQSGVIGKLGASLSPGGPVEGTITGVTGQNYAVQVSTNVATWGLLTNLTINTNGLAQFSDSSMTAFRQRFYRALLAQ